jgi:hypothetical protein
MPGWLADQLLGSLPTGPMRVALHTGTRFVVPDCREPDERHDPAGTRPAAYWYEWRDDKYNPGWDFVWVLCVECCARRRAENDPPPTRIRPLLDANTLKRVI